MDYFLENWGSFAGVLGVIVSAVGVWYAFLARRAAKSAEKAANEARQALTRNLRLVDVQEAIDIIHRLKDRLLLEEWSIAVELYSSLQSKLSDVRAALSADQEQYKETISDALREIEALQNLSYQLRPAGEFDMDIYQSSMEVLNATQQNLRTMRSEMMFSGEGTGI